MLNMLGLAGRPHAMYGLLEVDVTVPRRLIAEHEARTAETLSFTGYLTWCLARAVADDPSIQAYRKGRSQLVLFDDVDVGLMIERQRDGQPMLMGHVVRSADRKGYREIHDEIRAAQSTPPPAHAGLPRWFRTAMLLPWPLSAWVQRVIRWAARRDPRPIVAMAGTVSITSVGMMLGEHHGGWGLYPSTEAVGLVVGSITWKPAVVDGQIVPREILNLTVVLDHDVVDGAPAARFVSRLVELVEQGYDPAELDAPSLAAPRAD